MQLAIGLAMDLRLYRPTGQQKLASNALVDEAAVLLKMRDFTAEHGLQEMRAGLGCFYIISLCDTPLASWLRVLRTRTDAIEASQLISGTYRTFLLPGFSHAAASLC